MSYVRHYGLATGGILWALFAESGLISCCNFFGRLYGTDMAFGLSQHERRHKWPETPFPQKWHQPLRVLLAPLKGLTLNLPRSALSPVVGGSLGRYPERETL